MRRWWRAALLVATAGVAVLCSGQIDQRMGKLRAQEEVLYLWNGDQIKRIAPGFESILADLYWLRTVQYYGIQRRFASEQHFDLLKPLTEITTTLDPHFEIAYRYGATFLAEPYPVGAGDADAAVALLRKGVRYNEDNWRLWQYLAFFKFLYQDDYNGAVEVLMDASHRPYAPPWLETLAASFLKRRGQRDRARSIWQQIYDTSEEGPLKENAANRLKGFQADDEIQILNNIVAQYRARVGANPKSWEDLVAAGALKGQPMDPSGFPYGYSPQTGSFFIARKSRLFTAL